MCTGRFSQVWCVGFWYTSSSRYILLISITIVISITRVIAFMAFQQGEWEWRSVYSVSAQCLIKFGSTVCPLYCQVIVVRVGGSGSKCGWGWGLLVVFGSGGRRGQGGGRGAVGS